MSESDANVFIVDDDEGVRASLTHLLESVNQSARAYASAQEFLLDWDGREGGVLVVDIRMPGMSGLALQAKLQEMNAVLPIIFITGYGDVSLAVRAMQNGAFDFLSKPFENQELLDSVQRALAAEVRLNRLHHERQQVLDRMQSLTTRERQILEMMVEGKTNLVMASELSLSQRTVEVHRASVMKKMESDSVATLVQCVLFADNENHATMRSSIMRAAANWA
ncbi:MAG: response regulator transcription factor [Myxococcota bacterium]